MEIGFVGLGRMGGNMVTRLRRLGDHQVVAFDPNPQARDAAAGVGATAVASLEELVVQLARPRAVWVMVPSGEITDRTISSLSKLMDTCDTIVDGGNSKFTDSIAHGEQCKARGIDFIDAGTSGGIWGLELGYCLMVGGEKSAVERLRPIFETLAPAEGFLHVGPIGSGHYVKMVHNGIEYSMLQSYAEGFDILEACQFDLDLRAISHLWNHGGVIRSWLLELAERAFERDAHLTRIRGWVEDSGEGRWTLEQSIALSVPAPALAMALFARFDSRREDSFANKVIAALRNEFGGHAVKAEDGATRSGATTAS